MHIHIKYWNSNNKNKRSGKVSSRSSSAHKEMLPCMLRSSRSPPLSVRWRQDCARLKSPPLCSRRESHHFGGRDEKWASLRAQPALTADNPSVFFFHCCWQWNCREIDIRKHVDSSKTKNAWKSRCAICA